MIGMADQVLFDKLIYMDRLKAAGIAEDQARAHAEAMHEALRESVATKADLLALRTDLLALEQRLTIRMGVIGVAIVAILASLKFF
jgi:hypothetical protein